MNKKEVISNKQAISLIVLFIMGEASIYIQGIVANKDIWLSMILAVLASIPFFIMFARLHVLFPNKNLFDVIEICFGKIVGRIFIIIFIWYAFHSLALLFEDLGFFINTIMFMGTPKILTISILAAISAYMAKQGIEVFGRWGEIFSIVPIFLAIIIFLLLIPKMDINNLLPIV